MSKASVSMCLRRGFVRVCDCKSHRGASPHVIMTSAWSQRVMGEGGRGGKGRNK